MVTFAPAAAPDGGAADAPAAADHDVTVLSVGRRHVMLLIEATLPEGVQFWLQPRLASPDDDAPPPTTSSAPVPPPAPVLCRCAQSTPRRGGMNLIRGEVMPLSCDTNSDPTAELMRFAASL